MNIMFARVPLVDPDAFLEKWLILLGWIFSPLGFIVWALLIGMGCYAITNVPNWPSQLANSADGLLSPENLILLYVAFACIKACHEMGHAISCKKFGKQSGTGGEVHTIGIMFLIFTPVPYVDASSSWALTNKFHRAIVGAAGMWVELAIAAVAAMAWAYTGNTGQYAWLHAFAYNVMFVAGFSTIIFNANPLLRYDGYYILSDLLEIPNLGQRSKDYIFYLVKKYVWNVRFARNPAYSPSEQLWLFFYAIASFLMRAFVSFGIMFYLANVLNGVLIFLAVAMGIAAIITWVLMPIGKFLHYLATSGELARVRTRAILTTALAVAILLTLVGAIPFPDHARAQGVVEPAELRELFADTDGFISTTPALTLAPGKDGLAVPNVAPRTTLITARNPELESQLAGLKADQDYYRIRRDVEAPRDPARAAQDQKQVESYQELINNLQERIDGLTLKAPIAGALVLPDLENKKHGYLNRGDPVGVVASLDHLIVRAAALNELGGPLANEVNHTVEIRVKGRPDILLSGRIKQVLPAGSDRLPSASLGYSIGGEFNTAPDDKQGTKTVENFFEIRIDDLHLVSAPDDVKKDNHYLDAHHLPLYPGQRVVVRFSFTKKPLALQAWTSLLQLFQKKFRV
jgi:putative peptide zinc metalloprotease protein